MRKMRRMTGAATAVGLALGVFAVGQAVSKPEFKEPRQNIEAEFRLAKADCDTLQGNARDICIARARGRESVALAELAVKEDPTRKTTYAVRIARAQATYTLAIEKCDDLLDREKSACRLEAKSARAASRAHARAQLKMAQAKNGKS